MGKGEEVPDFFVSNLRDMDPFYRMQLIGKIMGEAIPIKFIMTKCAI